MFAFLFNCDPFRNLRVFRALVATLLLIKLLTLIHFLWCDEILFGYREFLVEEGFSFFLALIILSQLVGIFLFWINRWTLYATVVLFLSHLDILTRFPNLAYGADSFAQMALFFLLFLPHRRREIASVLEFRMGSAVIRALQFQLCVVYLSSGLHKAVGCDWWSGEAIWQASNHPSFVSLPMHWLAEFPLLAVIAGSATVLLEVVYPVGIWFVRTRKPILFLVFGMHAGIAFFLGLWLFAALMVVLNWFAFWRERPGRKDLQGLI